MSAAKQPTGSSAAVVSSLIDRAQRLQAPAVARYVASLRSSHPDESPTQIIELLQKRYLLAVTSSGGAVGATAAVPGIGTVAALGASAGETALFLEASALLALSIAEVHEIPIDDAERRKALVLAVALGQDGLATVGRVVGTRTGILHRLGAGAIPGASLSRLNKTLLRKFVKKFAIRRAPLVAGKLMPAGIGAVIGGIGNRAMGRRVIANARKAFGPPPAAWILDGSVLTEPGLPPGKR